MATTAVKGLAVAVRNNLVGGKGFRNLAAKTLLPTVSNQARTLGSQPRGWRQDRYKSTLAIDEPTIDVKNPFLDDEYDLELQRSRAGVPEYVRALSAGRPVAAAGGAAGGAAAAAAVGPSLPDPFALVRDELTSLAGEVKELLEVDHPVLATAARYFFELDGGKKVRPAMVLLAGEACAADLRARGVGGRGGPAAAARARRAQRRLAEITEMIHTASLFHDDVIDKSDQRRGNPTVNKAFGNKLAILAGDFLLARASVALARLRSVPVVELYATIIEELVRGEVLQMKPPRDASRAEALEHYMRKTYYKTGSLMANGCRGAALLAAAEAGGPPGEEQQGGGAAAAGAVAEAARVQAVAFEYGKRVGLAFQLIDDVLDFEADWARLGKPALADLKAGLATAPVLLAAEARPELDALIARRFRGPGDAAAAVAAVAAGRGLERARELAVLQADLAVAAALGLAPSPARDALVALALRVVDRTH